MGCIYKITNSVTGKVYIGLTTNTAVSRFKKHISMIKSGGCSALYSAFVKYGVDKFEVSTIVSTDDKMELMELEKYYILKLKTLSPHGYNLTTGGENCIVSEETKTKQSNAMKGREITWRDKVSIGITKLWENQEYRDKQTKQRFTKRGKYKDGIEKPLRLDLPIDEINERYRSGESINSIAKSFDRPFSTIKRRIINE